MYNVSCIQLGEDYLSFAEPVSDPFGTLLVNKICSTEL